MMRTRIHIVLLGLLAIAALQDRTVAAQSNPAIGPNIAAVEQEPAQAPGEVDGRLPRLIIVTESSSQVFSGTFKGQETTANNNGSAPPPLQLQYAGPTTGVQVFTYNESAVTQPLDDGAQVQWSPFEDTDALSPQDALIQKGRAFCRQLLIENPMLKLCEPDQKVVLQQAAQSPKDPLNPQQWALKAIGMQGAWNQAAFGSTGVRVCMVDTGFDYYHPDLKPNLWTNPREIPGNGIDDDKNGIVDDVYGANFVQGGTGGDPYDDNGHGTFVAGVVGAAGNNNIGITGVSQTADLIGCKFMDATGNGWISDAIRCWDYCSRQDAHVVSNSWGVYSTSPALQQAATALNARGVLVITSSGNSAKDTDQSAHVPSTLTTPNVVAVGALQSDGTVWGGSNYGLKSVDFAAPGVRVLGLGVGGSYVTMTGTSMAAPHVTGVAAIVLARFQSNGYEISTKYPSVGLAAQLKNILIQSSYKLPGQKVTLYGGVNATAAVALVPPAQATKVAAQPATKPPVRKPIVKPTFKKPTLRPTKRVGTEGVADAPGPAVDGSSCECSCAAEPAAALAPGLSISSTGTVVAVAPSEAGPPDGMGAEDAKSPADDMVMMAPAPAASRKLMGERRQYH